MSGWSIKSLFYGVIVFVINFHNFLSILVLDKSTLEDSSTVCLGILLSFFSHGKSNFHVFSPSAIEYIQNAPFQSSLSLCHSSKPQVYFVHLLDYFYSGFYFFFSGFNVLGVNSILV